MKVIKNGLMPIKIWVSKEILFRMVILLYYKRRNELTKKAYENRIINNEFVTISLCLSTTDE